MQLNKHWAAPIDDYVIDLAWAPDGQTLAAASAAGPITLFALSDGAKRHVLPGHDDGANALAFAPSGASLASGGQDGKVKLWDTAAGQHTASAELGTAWVEHLAWRPVAEPKGASPAAPLLAASAGRKLVCLNPDLSVRHAFKDAPKTIAALAWQPAGGCLASAYFGGVCLWDADDFIAQKEFPYANGIHALVWSPDNRWLVSGNQDPSVHLWLPEEDQEFHMSGYETKVKHLAYDRTSRWLATSGGKDACIWDCRGAGPEGREPGMYPHDAAVCALAFQHQHSLLATASQDGALMLWSPDRAQPLRATVRLPAPVTKLAWSPDDAHLAIGSEQGIVYVLKCVD
ncbi:MAG: WD40 repeat domain-containing protein [Opitutae bacterium]|nr:WD40 repeat domain-containing protein [Opitutae bacterium]